MEDEQQMRNADLASVKLTPQKTWFFERGDGVIFATGEEEANEILRNRTNWMRRDFKMIGVSDGKTYARIVKENSSKALEIRAKIDGLLVEQNKYLATYDRMKFEQLLGDSHEQVIKVKKLIKEVENAVAELEQQYKQVTKDSVKTAFDAEMAVAKGKIEYPENKNIVTPGRTGADRDKILANMPR